MWMGKKKRREGAQAVFSGIVQHVKQKDFFLQIVNHILVQVGYYASLPST